MSGPLVVEIRYWPDPQTGKRYAQYRVRGGSSLVWVPMGIHVAQEAIRSGLFHGLRVEEVGDEPRSATA